MAPRLHVASIGLRFPCETFIDSGEAIDGCRDLEQVPVDTGFAIDSSETLLAEGLVVDDLPTVGLGLVDSK